MPLLRGGGGWARRGGIPLIVLAGVEVEVGELVRGRKDGAGPPRLHLPLVPPEGLLLLLVRLGGGGRGGGGDEAMVTTGNS